MRRRRRRGLRASPAVASPALDGAVFTTGVFTAAVFAAPAEGPDGLADYQDKHNLVSMDGLPTGLR